MQIGLTISDLDGLNYGDVVDMITEAANDNYEYDLEATQDDFDRFAR